MNRWWGSSQDSDRQSAERSSRYARRVIAGQRLPSLSDSDEDYRDCDLSNSFLNVDGNDDAVDEHPVVNMPAFQDENGVDDADYYKKLSAVKNRQFNKNEVQFWFTSFETSLKHIGVKSQWSKREVLHSLLQDEVQVAVKQILKKDQESAGNTPYKTLKLELLKLYAPKPEAAFKTALSRQLTDTPSSLAKQIIDDICICDEPLQSPCCQRVVWGMWSAKLPENILHRLTGQKFTKDNYKNMLELADEVYYTNQNNSSPASAMSVSAASGSNNATPSNSLNETQPAIPYAVNAATRGNRGGGRGQRGGRGRGGRGRGGAGRGNNNQNQNSNSNQNQSNSTSKWPTPKHADVPNSIKELCFNHHTYGRGAYHCTDPLTCNWASIPPAPRPKPVNQ